MVRRMTALFALIALAIVFSAGPASAATGYWSTGSCYFQGQNWYSNPNWWGQTHDYVDGCYAVGQSQEDLTPVWSFGPGSTASSGSMWMPSYTRHIGINADLSSQHTAQLNCC